MQHDAICNVELRRAIIRQSILYWALQALQCRGPTPERALTGDAWLESGSWSASSRPSARPPRAPRSDLGRMGHPRRALTWDAAVWVGGQVQVQWHQGQPGQKQEVIRLGCQAPISDRLCALRKGTKGRNTLFTFCLKIKIVRIFNLPGGRTKL